jgi:hypothetical protein
MLARGLCGGDGESLSLTNAGAAVLQIGNSQIEFVIAASRSSLLPWFPTTIKAIPKRHRVIAIDLGKPDPN